MTVEQRILSPTEGALEAFDVVAVISQDLKLPRLERFLNHRERIGNILIR